VKFGLFLKFFLVRRKLPFFGPKFLPALFLKKPWYPWPFEIMAEALAYCILYSISFHIFSTFETGKKSREYRDETLEHGRVLNNDVRKWNIITLITFSKHHDSCKPNLNTWKHNKFILSITSWEKSRKLLILEKMFWHQYMMLTVTFSLL
jgi:hypothetical protein